MNAEADSGGPRSPFRLRVELTVDVVVEDAVALERSAVAQVDRTEVYSDEEPGKVMRARERERVRR